MGPCGGPPRAPSCDDLTNATLTDLAPHHRLTVQCAGTDWLVGGRYRRLSHRKSGSTGLISPDLITIIQRQYMKHLSNSRRWLLLLALATSGHFAAQAQSVGIGTTTPDASAVLDLKSTVQGLLLPRLTSVQRGVIAAPAAGLLVFQTDNTPGVYYYDGTFWRNLTTGLVSSAAGATTTLAGSTPGFADGTGAAAQFSIPAGVACDGSGNVYVADTNNNRIRVIVAATGVVSTLASGFNLPTGVACDGSGNVYVADTNSNRIRVIVAATGVVSTLAGTGAAGFINGRATTAQFNHPTGVACDGSGNVYVADQGNNCIRFIIAGGGDVYTTAGTGTAGFVDGLNQVAQFNNPSGVACDGSGNVYVADPGNNRIRRIVVATGEVSTLAGSTQGYAEGTGAAAQFNRPTGVASAASGNVYVTDTNNSRIRVVK